MLGGKNMLKTKIIIKYLLPIFIIVLSIVLLALNEIAIFLDGFVILIPIALNFISKRK
jgi:hypothetical protein